MLQGKHALAYKKLDEAAAYLDRISPNEEFDQATWLTLQGKNAFFLKDYSTSIRYYEKALVEILPSWTIGKVIALIPLMVAYTYTKERDRGLATAEHTLEALQKLNSPAMNRLFIDSVEQALLAAFPHDKTIQRFLATARDL